jgi:zinc transport system substrate-binding protein
VPLRSLAVAVVLVLACGVAGCGDKPKPRPRLDKIRVGASISILAHLIECVGGKYVKVVSAVPGDQNPYSYAPSEKRVKDLAASGIFFSIGMHFESALIPRLDRMQKGMTFVDVTEGLAFREMDGFHAAVPPENGDARNPTIDFRNRDTRDPYIWLDPGNAKVIVENIRDALKEIDPAHDVEYEQNCVAFLKELAAVDTEIRASLAPLRDREFLVFHPAFGYFADAYDLKQAPMGYKGDAPTPEMLRYWAEHVSKKKQKILFVQPQFNAHRAQDAAQTFGGIVMPMNPLAEDYLGNLREMAKSITTALKDNEKR